MGNVSFLFEAAIVYAIYVLITGLMAGKIWWGLSSAASLCGIAIFTSGVRFLFWLPSFILWCFTGDISFGEWLAPGFYVEME